MAFSVSAVLRWLVLGLPLKVLLGLLTSLASVSSSAKRGVDWWLANILLALRISDCSFCWYLFP